MRLIVLCRGSDGRPSFASVVANVDSDGGKYIATSSVQESRVEMVEDLQRMIKVPIPAELSPSQCLADLIPRSI